VASSTAESTNGAAVRQLFQSPPKKYRPLVRWWWLGNDVAEAELRREIDVLDAAGFGGAEIQAFNKGFANKDVSQAQVHRINSFATPSFFRHVAVAAEEARNRGMFVDYTFGSGWPFGGGEAITPELSSIELRSTHLSIAGPTTLRQKLQIPSITDGDPSTGPDVLKQLPDGWKERMKKRTKVVAVVAVRGEDAQWDFHAPGGPRQTVVKPGQLQKGTSVDLSARLQPDGVLQWDVPPGTWQVFVFCSVPTMQRVNGAAGEGLQLVMDHLSSEAFAAHAKRVGDDAVPYIGEFFGNGLRAIFCDSLEVSANLFWSDDFLAEFRRRRGYDLLPYLPILKVQSHSAPFGEFADLPVFEIAEIGDQVRNDYRQTVSDLITERFYGEFNKWAHAHKLLSRTQAHGAPAEVLRIYGEADIPETEDLYGNNGYDFLKMAASSAHVYGRAIVGSESFVWPNVAYQTTPEKMKVAADELLTAGVNAIVYHGFPYIVPDLPAPGWHPFTGFGEGNYSSEFNELNPFWTYLAPLNSYLSRVQYISQAGTNVAAVALYRNDLAHSAYEMPPAPKLNEAIMAAGYNYDHINADSLLHCTVRDRMLTTLGGARFRVLVLPRLDAIDATLAERLHSFAAAGLPILFADQMPLSAEGFFENTSRTQRVQSAMHSLRSLSNVYSSSDTDAAVTTLRRVANPNIKFHSKPLSFIQKRIGQMNLFFLRNDSDAMQSLNAEFQAEGTPELWNPWTGGTASIARHRRKGDWVEIDLDLEPFSSALIVFDPHGGAASSSATVEPVRKLKSAEPIGDNGWKLTATGLVPTGKTADIHRDLPMLIDWSLDSELRGMSGRGTYTTSFTVSATNAGSRLVLDLGNVKDVAEVTVNGKHAATLLLRPYQTDITDFVRPGENLLEVAVTNSLFNSMVLREPRPFLNAQAENLSGLMSAGLIGPVQLKVME
jgi:hypothetical protein